jgi:hypothetical protein
VSEAKVVTQPLTRRPEEFIRDLYVLEFLRLPPMVRLVNRSDTASENPRPTPDQNGWAKKIHPFTKSRSPLKNLCENNSWNFFFALASFQNNSKKYRWLSENPEFFFRAGKKNPETIFWKSMYTHSPRKPEIFPTTQKTPQNLKFSDVIAIADNSRASCSITLKKLSKLCAKKSFQQEPVKLQVQIAIKQSILEK